MDDMSSALIAAKGDEQAVNRFIQNHKRFILSCANRIMNRYVTESDDEYSIALIAFSEAMEAYDESKGAFSTLARTVIQRRLLDHIRSESRYHSEIAVEPYVLDADLGDEEEISALQIEVLHRTAEEENQSADMAPGTSAVEDEIEAVQEVLAPYGFALFDVADCSPRAEKTRKACASAVRELLASEKLLLEMRSKKALPMKELAKRSGVSKKILDRHRKYVIASAEILSGDYPVMAEYMSFMRE